MTPMWWEQPGLRLPFDGTLSEAEQRMLEQFTVATTQELADADAR